MMMLVRVIITSIVQVVTMPTRGQPAASAGRRAPAHKLVGFCDCHLTLGVGGEIEPDSVVSDVGRERDLFHQ